MEPARFWLLWLINIHDHSKVTSLFPSSSNFSPSWIFIFKRSFIHLELSGNRLVASLHSNRLEIKNYPTPALVAFTFRSRINKCPSDSNNFIKSQGRDTGKCEAGVRLIDIVDSENNVGYQNNNILTVVRLGAMQFMGYMGLGQMEYEARTFLHI